jgi:hypothetical protein
MRSLFFRLRARHVFCALGAVGMASGCVAGSGLDTGKQPVGMDAGRGKTTFIKIDGGFNDAAPVDGGKEVDKNCGTVGFCGYRGIPDDRLACANVDAGTGGSISSPDASAVLDAGALLDGRASAPDGGLRDAGDGAPDAGGADAGDAETRALPPVPEPKAPLPDAGPALACQVGRDSAGLPIHECVPSGLGADGSPCASVRDCAAGFACVGEQTGQCRHYCCSATAQCDGPGTFCAERTLLDGTSNTPLQVPVCTPGESCGLLEPYPCSAPGCSCPSPTACAIVRGDGTRGCVTPGPGKLGDACPCAAGYYCSVATKMCLKMCKTDGIDMRCSPGKCQVAAGFPQGFGLCVGYAPSVQ